MSPTCSPELEQEAMTIAQLIYQQAVISEDGSTNWLSMNYDHATKQVQLNQLGFDFYNGRTGIALFLAAVDKISGQEVYRDFILNQVLQPLQSLLSMSPLALNSVTRIGGMFGLGYALTKISQMMNEKDLLDNALHAGLLITPQRIEEDRYLDLLLGSGGALLNLLAIYQATGDERMLDRAILCGEHLLNHRVISDTGHHAWPTIIEGQLLTGFSHGAAGIAYALLRLYDATMDSRFLMAGADGIAFEHKVLSLENNTNENLTKSYMVGWCRGAPGIGLGRLAALHILDTATIREDIERALDVTLAANVNYTEDHLCCGNLGRAEILLEIANWLDDAGLIATVYKYIAQVLERKNARGEFTVSPFFNSIYQPGFFKGLAGIGYSLLRMAHPQSLPLILAWK